MFAKITEGHEKMPFLFGLVLFLPVQTIIINLSLEFPHGGT